MLNSKILQTTKNWINSFVIELNLCPFAKAEIIKNSVRFEVSEANSEEQLLQHLQDELNYLNQHPEVETTLVIHPQVLQEFEIYNEFLELADELLEDMQLEGTYQIASFHPDYQFSNSQMNDAENYSNKSPYPMLHILREESLEKAIEQYPLSDDIPKRNIATLNSLGKDYCQSLLKNCYSHKP